MNNFCLWGSFLLIFSQISHAGLITSAADPALTGGTTITFNDLALANYGSVTSNGVTFSNADIARTPAIQGISITDRYSTISAPYSSNVLKYSTSVFPSSESSDVPHALLRFDFSSPVKSFGLDLISSSYPISLTAFNAAGDLLETFSPLGGSAHNVYRGISSYEDIAYAILGNYRGYDYIVIDNLTFSASAVPVPAALPLLISGLAFLGCSRYRRTA
ncbi:MAG TPA: hypothetical protein DCO68_00300 [Methylophilaceae bacterium]|nr:hypothetical protein [Methylophilaceae bacterium]HAJ70495.1 hypothetical protein [Methylophilaceae bacterium]